MTRRLYYEDAYLTEFEAVVTECRQSDGGWEVFLDQTAFYPEGGGQPCDFGMLGDVSVVDVQEKDGAVCHLCSAPLEAGVRVHGRIDRNRRLAHMREHSGEHIISGIICKKHGCSNVGFHMGKDFVTIDFSCLLTEEDIAEAERLANEKVLENVEIIAEYPDEQTLRSLDYRSKKELTGAIRIVTVPGADVCACCGTHVARTGEIGPVKVISAERFKGGSRLAIVIGKKALDDYRIRFENVQKISALLSAKPEDVAEAVEKQLQAANALKLELGALKMRMLEEKADAIEEGSPFCVMFEQGLSPVDVRKLSDKLSEKTDFAAVFCGDDKAGYQYVICARNMDVALFGKELNGALQGRGGGKNPMIQGFLGAKKEEILQFLQEKELWTDEQQ